MLELFSEHDAHATCFLLGDVAAAHPDVVRRIASRGHEVGVHGWHHHRVFQLDVDAYRESLKRAKSLLEDLTGASVIGYRAVAMSITRTTRWAYDVLQEVGFRYSSSVYPFRGARYGIPDAPVGPHEVATSQGETLLEIPFSVVRVGSFRLPALGGGTLRHLPLAYSRFAMRSLEREGRRGVLYLHPYELDVGAVNNGFPVRLLECERRAVRRILRGQYRNRHRTEAKLGALLRAWRFSTLQAVFAPSWQHCRDARDTAASVVLRMG